MTWKKITLILVLLSAVQGVFTLCAQLSPRVHDEAVAKKYFSADYLEKAAVYKERRLQAQRLIIPIEILVNLLFIFGGPLRRLHRRLSKTRLSPVLQSTLIISAMILFEYLLRLPFSYKFGYLLEKEFGFSNQTGTGYLTDYAKGLAIGLAFSVILTALFIGLYVKFKRGWIWFTGGAFTLFSILTIFIIPVLIEPLFFDYKNLPAGSLRTSIENLAAKQNIHLESILEMKASEKTNRTNAYVSGIWGTHRVVLFDTLMTKFSEDEITAIVGHEMGHSVLGHIWKNLLTSVASIWLMLFASAWLIRRLVQKYPEPIIGRNIGVLIPVLLLIFSLANFIENPVSSAVSRKMEANADFFALEVTQNPAAAISMEIKLTKDNLSDPNPRMLPYIWYASHPDPIRRIQMAEEFQKRIKNKE